MARILLVDNGRLQEVQMGQELTIGRAYSNLLRLEGEEISRVHAIVYKRGDDYIVRDLDSKNGVLLNGQKIMNSLLAPGDDVQVGNYFLIFDPPPDFDVTAFLKRHDLAMPSTSSSLRVDAANETPDNSHKDQDTEDSAPDSSVDPISLDPHSIYYTMASVEKMLLPQSAPLSMDFLSDVLRMHRDLAGPDEFEDVEDENRLYQHFMNTAVSALGADRGVIVLKDEAGEVLRLGAIFPKDKDVAVNRVVLRAVLREHQVVLCNDAKTNPEFARTETIRRDNIGSLIAYPLMRGGDSFGLMYCDAVARQNAFRHDHLLILHFLARILVLCLHRSETSR